MTLKKELILRLSKNRIMRTMPGLEDVKQQTKIMYDTWRNSLCFCPAFDSNVSFSLKGWRHITGATGSKKRSQQDTYRRLMLLPHAKKIIEKSTTIQNVSIRHGRKYYTLEAMIEVEENGKTNLRKVRVIFIEDRSGRKIFYSVMDKKVR